MRMKYKSFSLKPLLLGFAVTAAALATVVVVLHHGPELAQHLHGGHGDTAPTEAVKHVRDGVAALGKEWNASVRSETAKLYATLHKTHNDSGIKRTINVSYGNAAQQKLDLYVPDQGFNELGPVLIFLHDGDDRIVAGSDDTVYSNVAKFAARVGGVGINADYRATNVDDVRRLIEWARNNVKPYGGDPESILVLGNGEGATLLASYLFNEKAQSANGPGIAGAVLGSGMFAALPSTLVDDYQGKAVPILMWSAALDPVESGVVELKDKLCAKYGNCPAFALLEGHNHGSPMMSIDSGDSSVINHLFRFYHMAVRK